MILILNKMAYKIISFHTKVEQHIIRLFVYLFIYFWGGGDGPTYITTDEYLSFYATMLFILTCIIRFGFIWEGFGIYVTFFGNWVMALEMGRMPWKCEDSIGNVLKSKITVAFNKHALKERTFPKVFLLKELLCHTLVKDGGGCWKPRVNLMIMAFLNMPYLPDCFFHWKQIILLLCTLIFEDLSRVDQYSEEVS